MKLAAAVAPQSRAAEAGPPLLDTHAWIWWIEQDARLGVKAIALLDALPPERRPFLCDISLWEVATLVERGRLELDVPLDEWLAAAAHPRSVQVLPVSPRIAAEIERLPETFHRDPADRLIVATSRAHHIPVLTHDERIRRSRLVRLWRP
ncbi:MAG TPA: type II toxin-antitoxin system VapC family toxin [Vicinamibacterales bacterium]|jgi:PIN domain nuclease of toxin-antitoxin system|nr:type II toxin-antitoxin system VapC family toxin [Vicinamibacterales bacterium]